MILPIDNSVMRIVIMIGIIVTTIIIRTTTTTRRVIVMIIIIIIHHSMLDLLGIEFHHFFIYGILNIISWIISLKSLYGSTFFFIFYLIDFLYFIIQH